MQLCTFDTNERRLISFLNPKATSQHPLQVLLQQRNSSEETDNFLCNLRELKIQNSSVKPMQTYMTANLNRYNCFQSLSKLLVPLNQPKIAECIDRINNQKQYVNNSTSLLEIREPSFHHKQKFLTLQHSSQFIRRESKDSQQNTVSLIYSVLKQQLIPLARHRFDFLCFLFLTKQNLNLICAL